MKQTSFRYRRKRVRGACAEEVMRMGDGRWAKALRFLVWFIIVLFLMILTAHIAY